MNLLHMNRLICVFSMFLAAITMAQTSEQKTAPIIEPLDDAHTQVNAVVIPLLMSEAQAVLWLKDDPELSLAKHEWQASQAAAELTASSPYEWSASYTRQQRDYRNTGLPKPDTSNEWNVDVERSIRLPGKVTADKRIANASLQAAQAQFHLAQRRSVEALITAYTEALLAQAQLNLLKQQHQFARNNLHAVQKRVSSGDAAALEARLAEAEAANVAARLSAAETQATTALSYLTQRYPTLNADTKAVLPEPIAPRQPLAWWQEHILSTSDEQQLAQAEQQATSAEADRASLDRIPDPTIGLFTARETYGNEQLVGVRIRMPLPGERRSLQFRQKLNQSLAAKDSLELVRRQLTFSAQRAFNQAQGDFQRWQLAEQNANAQRENARLLQKAYSLGEQDLQSLLLVQQQNLRAAEDEQIARAAALKSYYQLLLDAKLLWRNSLFTDSDLSASYLGAK